MDLDQFNVSLKRPGAFVWAFSISFKRSFQYETRVNWRPNFGCQFIKLFGNRDWDEIRLNVLLCKFSKTDIFNLWTTFWTAGLDIIRLQVVQGVAGFQIARVPDCPTQIGIQKKQGANLKKYLGWERRRKGADYSLACEYLGTGWQRPIECLIFLGSFSAKELYNQSLFYGKWPAT